ncbi:MAG: hypothetical protein EZS28_014050 [Streblomastix strix]|uniref:Uncharacterized protein n=1 Tax=Streblomastix strix TaxID=222440 RepID=A0A5J4W6S4_9EUKA|nr:MAG: hypothetical protein EZS28_014050 [Streblomastix strix]
MIPVNADDVRVAGIGVDLLGNKRDEGGVGNWMDQSDGDMYVLECEDSDGCIEDVYEDQLDGDTLDIYG